MKRNVVRMTELTAGWRYKWRVLHGSSNSLRAQLVRGAMSVGGLKLLSLPLTLAVSVLLARALGPEGYGQYVFVMAVISLLALPFGPGLGQLITREVAKYHHGEEWGLFRGLLRRASQWITAGSVLIVLVIVIIAVAKAEWRVSDRWTLLLIASLMLPLLGLNALLFSTLRGLRHVFHAQFPELLTRPGLHLIFAGGLLLAGLLNPATALVSQLVATAAAFLLGARLLRQRCPMPLNLAAPDYRDAEWGKAVLPFILLAAAGTLNSEIGILALGWLGTNADVAALRVAQSGAVLVAFSLTVVNLVIGPHITRAYRDQDRERLQRLSTQSARAALAVALPIALPLIFLGGPIIHLIYGESYANSATWPLAILTVSQLVNVAFGSVGLFLTMSGFEQDTLYGQIIALMVNVLVAVILVPPFGAVGAALSVAIGLLVWNVVLTTRFVQRLRLRPSAL